jgi:hypothetical protein
MFSAPKKMNKTLRKSSTLQDNYDYGDNPNVNKKSKKLKRSGSLTMLVNKLVKVEDTEKDKADSEVSSEHKPSIWSTLKCPSLNEWMVFAFLCILIAFGIIMSIIEFSYYSNSI